MMLPVKDSPPASLEERMTLGKRKNFSLKQGSGVLMAGADIMKKHNTHDSGYKMLFSSHEMVRQLLTSFVNEEWVHKIEYNTLERIDKSFVSERFESRESDIIYRARFRGRDVYIFILVEFQSTVDRFMALRILRYIVELYEYLVKNHKLKRLPAVFPVMLYNGEKRWTAPAGLDRLIEKSIPLQYIPNFSYYKIAENEFDREFLKTLNNAVAALFYTENCDGKEMKQEIDNIVRLLRYEKGDEITAFSHWFKYMFQGMPELVDEIKEITGVKNMLRTSLKKYSKELIQEGIEKGKLDTAMNLLKEKMTVKKIAAVTGLPVERIEKLKNEM